MDWARRSLLFLLCSLISISIFGQAGNEKINKDSADIINELFHSTTVNTIVAKVKEVGPNYCQLLNHPKTFTMNWKEMPRKRPSAIAALSFSTLLTLFCFGLYKLIFKTNPFNKFLGVKSSNFRKKKARKDVTTKPRIIRFTTKTETTSISADGNVVGHTTSHGISPLPSFDFPEAGVKGLGEPQIIIFHVGFLNVFWDGIIPDSFSSKKALTIIGLLYSLICALSLYPVASLLGSSMTFSETFSYTVFLFSFAFLYLGLWIVLAVILFFDVLNLKLDFIVENKKNFPPLFAGGCLWVSLTLGVVMTIFFSAFKTFYAFTFWKFMATIAGAFAVSAIACPIIFIPALYLYFRLKKLIEIFY